MTALMPIGDFARVTHLSVKALRHYHDVRLLEPAAVDPATGYRFYATAQVPVALAIRRFRDLDLPIDQVRAVLDASDPAARNQIILRHLARMENQLEQTQLAVSSLRSLLEGSPADPAIEVRAVGATAALAIRETVDWDDTESWLAEAQAELNAALPDPGARAGPDGALYPRDYFEAHRGELVAFIPVHGAFAVPAGVDCSEIPAARLAVVMHEGPFDTLDQTYGELGTFVVERGIGTNGPIREHYLVTETANPSELRTEVGWPIVTPSADSTAPPPTV